MNVTDKSLSSSVSTITCSIWSSGRSISTLELHSANRPISSITFSSGFSEEEKSVADDPQSESRVGHSLTPPACSDSFALSERSLFQDRLLLPIPSRNDDAPKAPSRQRQEYQKITSHPFNKPLFDVKSGNRGNDVQPRMPTRSSHVEEDGSTDRNYYPSSSFDVSTLTHSSLDTSETRCNNLLHRIESTERVLDSSDRRMASMLPPQLQQQQQQLLQEATPPKLPVRTNSNDVTTNDLLEKDNMEPSKNASVVVQKEKGWSLDDLLLLDDLHNRSSHGKKKDTINTAKLRGRKPKFLKTPPTPQSNELMSSSREDTSSLKESNTDASPPSDTNSEPARTHRIVRSRSKDPPQRFATAPASLTAKKDATGKKSSYIPKRHLKKNKTTSEQRLRRQFVSNSLTSILEDEYETTTSPVREDPKAPVSCPAAIETAALEDSDFDLKGRALRTRGRSWAGTASRNLL